MSGCSARCPSDGCRLRVALRLRGVGHKRDGYSAAVATSRRRAEYFRGENGAGIGASHQTGWAGTLALVFVLAGMLHSPLDAIAGIVAN